jgi:hypothetical protein
MDDGTNQNDIGIAAPSAPTAVAQTPPAINCENLNAGTFSNWELGEGDNFVDVSDYVQIDSDGDSKRAIALTGLTSALTLDTTAFGGNSWTHTMEDIFRISVRIGDTSKLVKTRIEFLLEAPTSVSTTEDVTNYFWYEWMAREENSTEVNESVLLNSGFRSGLNVWSELVVKRGDFKRVGQDQAKDWNAVKGVRVIFVSTDVDTYVFNNLRFTGGTSGPLTGYYEYKQVNIYDSGSFLMESIPSDATAQELAVNAAIQVTPAAHASPVNMKRFYRRGGKLDKWYLVKETTSSLNTAFNDVLSDDEAIIANETLNEYTSLLPDNIQGIVGPYFDRVLYITNGAIYPSLPNDFSRYDTRHVVENAGSDSEINLFIARVSERELVVATTNEIYVLSGDGTEDPITGLLDFRLAPLGISKPPISRDFAIEDNSLFYRASDGWRKLAGSSSTLLSTELELLYRGETRHGINGVLKPSSLPVMSSCTFSGNRFIASVEHSTLGRLLHVYHIKQGYWNLAYTGISGFTPLSLFTEEDGTLICGTEAAGDKYLRELFTGTLWDELSGFPVTLKTVYDDFGLKYNRKDCFTLKIQADTGNANAATKIYADGSASSINLGNLAFNGFEEESLDISSTVGKKKSLQLEMTGTFTAFKFYGFELLADVLPTQTKYLRIPYTNLGTQSRKRVLNFPVVLDTLGNNVTFKPFADGSQITTAALANASTEFNSGYKKTHQHWFDKEIVGTDFGGTLECSTGYFEFYGVALEEIVSEKLPVPTRWMAVPATNFGTYSRKRFNTLPFVVNPRGATLTITPVLDGVAQTTSTVTGTFKGTYTHRFSTDVTAVDVGLIVSGTAEFEFYEILKPAVLEVLPEPVTYLRLPPQNFGTYQRKRFDNIPFVIDTRSTAVTVTPVLDGVSHSGQSFTTSGKTAQTIHLGATYTATNVTLIISGTAAFEFYEMLTPERMEVLPNPSKYLTIPNDNFGSAEKKRVRVLPLVLDTRAGTVTYTPIVDGVAKTASTFASSGKTTLLHYFTESDGVIGIDFGGILTGAAEFEFYGMLRPESVENLPVARKHDQLGPFSFERMARLKMLFLDILPTGTSLTYKILVSDTQLTSGIITTTANVQNIYEIQLPKGVNPSLLKIVLSASEPFHRFGASIRYDISGNDTKFKTVKVGR